MKRSRQSNKDDGNEQKKQKIDNDLLNELNDALSEVNINDVEKNDEGIEEITKGIGNLNIGPIKVVIIPFAHGGVRDASDNEIQLVKGMDVKLITSTSGTCTIIYPDSYLKLLSPIATRVKFKEHTNNPNFDNQILEYFNNYQHYTVNKAVDHYNEVEYLGLKPTYIPEIKRWHYKIPNTHRLDPKTLMNRNIDTDDLLKQGYKFNEEKKYYEKMREPVDVVSNTYEMKCFNDQTTCTKVYGSIPETDPLWGAIQPIARIMNVKASDYSEKPFVIYMYIDQNGNFRKGITLNTYIGITLHEILHNTNETIKHELRKDVPMHYVFADPNCSSWFSGDPNCSFYVPNCGKTPKSKSKTKKSKTKKSKTKKSKSKTKKSKSKTQKSKSKTQKSKSKTQKSKQKRQEEINKRRAGLPPIPE